ncbi:RING zinc finger protein-like protein [Dendryphion nanum]|uniref:E3 ubiquitin-protein ligase listerin n=1 Tax=Dendryphion nanum TaxID=256645 RepID=A0A9P9IEG5_9PLEO|nr:RING zinc finger protein-like protein [Dendryphion nanum]
MSKRSAKSQASSARAATGGFGSAFNSSTTPAFGGSPSQLSYITEPPDLSSISDPNVVVYFRNLSKRDSTTKGRALEDIQARVLAQQEPVEEPVLEAWIKMYPRTSIDNAKAVRQSAHILHGHISASAGKRIAKYMPKAVGAWLSGLYDADRSVVEATQSSLRQVFTSPEKIQNIRRAYQQPILEYCKDALEKESALTLSDERTVTPDDAQAKYSRVMSACVSLLGSLLSNLKTEDLSKHQSDYDSLFGDAKLWALASHADPLIRRSVHRFLKTSLSKQSQAIGNNLDVISKSYLATALNSDQNGSAYDYVETLSLLTSLHPTVWTDHYISKTSVDRRLRQFLKKGSQFGPREFWDRLVDLFQHLPRQIIPSNGADAAELLNSLHGGIIRKDELKSNLISAFGAYLEISDFVSRQLPDEDRQKVLDELVLPIVVQYLRPTPENSQWSIPPNPKKIITRIFSIDGILPKIEQRWPNYTQQFIDDIKTSAPEQSKDYERSQSALVKQANRFSYVQQFAIETASSLRATFSRACASIIEEALHIVISRNGKPYGAAGVVAELLHQKDSFVLENDAVRQSLESFVENELPKLVVSPSSAYLVDILYSLSEYPSFTVAWTASLKKCLGEDDSSARTTALEALLTSPRIPRSFLLASSDKDVQNYVLSNVQGAVEGLLDWDSFARILQSPSQILASETSDEILSLMAESLSLTSQAPFALQGFRYIVKANPALLKDFITTPNGSSLLRSLLLASESPNEEIAQEAAAVNASIQTLLSAETDSKQSVFGVIHHGLRDASQTAVTVETLVDLAKRLVQPGDSWETTFNILPNQKDWDSALAPFLSVSPKSSLAITSPLAGAVYLVDASSPDPEITRLSRDADGYAPAFRIGQYVTRLFKNTDLINLDQVPADVRESLLYNLSLTLQLADDNLGLAGANHLWAGHTPEVETEAMAFIADAQDLINQDLTRLNQQWTDEDDFAAPFIWANGLISNVKSDISASNYYAARATSVVIAEQNEARGWNSGNTSRLQGQLKDLRRDKHIFPLLAFLNAFKKPLAATGSCERLCNELIADLTGIDIKVNSAEGLRQLVLLNNLLHDQEDITKSITKQRLVFFIKHVVPWLQEDEPSLLPVRAELCRALVVLLPNISDIYGEHWSDILNALASSWSGTKDLDETGSENYSPLPFAQASLKLYAKLRSLTELEDPNDDLLDAWNETEPTIAAGLVNLLKNSRHFPDEFHQPLKIVNDVLARQISTIPLQHLQSTEDLFPLLYVESQPVQQTAFEILHKQIPAKQEQISIDSALEKSTARLPEELLSLILEAPTVAALSEANFERSMPLPLRGYLLSWILVFDHLEHASFKVKTDYVDHIKEGEYLPGLLNFMFDFLGHAQNKPVDVSRFEITEYKPDQEPPKRDTQWLLTHLYFLCLLHLPSLTKSWYIDCKSRPIVVTLEPWTEKYISPPVISAALASVSTWSSTEIDPNSPFSIRISPKAYEITASYLVDDQTMSMRLKLPKSFPLTSASIEGLNRVAVNEQKWQSWLRTSLGAITIFNGSLIDALTTFKRNVDGAMKGQSECAICYSVVGSDRKLPDKRCGTCKNLFHGSCLFKWFKTSGNSSCPLCRNPFNYG